MAVDKKVLKTCVVCKRKFLGWFSEKYCSDDCRIEGTRLKNRNRQRKSRKVLDLREGAISQQLGELGLGDTQYPMYNHELVTTMLVWTQTSSVAFALRTGPRWQRAGSGRERSGSG